MMKYLLILFFSLFSVHSFAAPKADLWGYWNTSNESNQQVVDHSIWQTVLDDNLIIQGQNHLFNYAHMSTKDKQALKTYLNNLTQLDPLKLNKKNSSLIGLTCITL